MAIKLAVLGLKEELKLTKEKIATLASSYTEDVKKLVGQHLTEQDQAELKAMLDDFNYDLAVELEEII